MTDEQATAPDGGASRRALLLGVGGAGAAAVLTACGDDGGDDGGGDGGEPGGSSTTGAVATTAAATTPADGQSSAATSGARALAKVADVPVGGGVVLAEHGLVLTQPVVGQFRAFSNICTHQRCPLSGVDGGVISCNCHQSRFSIEDGAPKSGPATTVKDSSGNPVKLPPTAVRVEGDSIVKA